jgi:hypothetical protein
MACSRGGERNGPMAAEIESVTGVERSDGRDLHTHTPIHKYTHTPVL